MKYMIKWLVLVGVLVVLFCCSAAMAAEVASGSCGADGNNLTWTLDDSSTLTISGTGKMKSYSSDNVPWYSNRTSIKTVNIGTGVTSIGDNAFNGCSSLGSITIPEGVTSIGKYAFNNCISLRNITIPEGVMSIPIYCFYGCQNLINISLPDTVTGIGTEAFGRCKSLTGIILPNNVVIIRSQAFDGCIGLTTVSLPRNVRLVEPNAFSNCVELTSVNISEENLYYTSVNGVLYNKSLSTLVYYPANKEGEIVIPDSVTRLEGYAFSDCRHLPAVFEIPNHITSLGASVFRSSTSGICVPDSVTDIDNNAFDSITRYYCNRNSNAAKVLSAQRYYYLYDYFVQNSPVVVVKNVYDSSGELTGVELCDLGWGWNTFDIPEYITRIGDSVLSNMGVTAIPNWITHIGNRAFASNTTLLDITIPSSVTTMGQWAFADCTNLQSLAIEAGLTRIERCAFENCSNLTSVTIPDTVTYIEYDAFSGCNSLSTITLPGGLESLPILPSDCVIYVPVNSLTEEILKKSGRTYFTYDNNPSCGEGLTWSLSSTGVLNISGSGAMTSHPWGRSLVTKVIIGNGVTSICDEAFTECHNLTSVTIPTTVASIGDYAFLRCDNLGDCSIPTSVTSIGDGAFYGCSSLSNLSLPSGLTYLGNSALGACTGLTSIVLPDGITSIGNSTFIDCRGLTNITIPDTVTSIGAYAFQNCTGLTDVAIPNRITELPDGVFYGCSSLTSVAIPDGVTRLGEAKNLGSGAFANCTGLTNITFPNNISFIAPHTFQNCTSLTSISIPSSVGTIGYEAFTGCAVLHDITIRSQCLTPDNQAFDADNDLLFHVIRGSKAEAWAISKTYDYDYLDEPAHGQCGPNLIWQLELNGVLSITGTGPMDDYDSGGPWGDSITSVSMQNGITSIGEMAFRQCSGLTNIVIPDSVTQIGERAFFACTSLTTITIPAGVTNLGLGIFDSCSNLTSIAIPSSVTEIASHAFGTCTNLSSIYIPKSVTSIGRSAFYNCSSLRTIIVDCDGLNITFDELYAYNLPYPENVTVNIRHENSIPGESVEATCTENGHSAGLICTVCGGIIEEPEEIPAIGHTWGESTYTWNETHTEVIATRICAHDTAHMETETVAATAEVTKEPTCTVSGETTYTGAAFENEAFEAQTLTLVDIDALGHSSVTDEAVEASCTATGLTMGSHCKVCGEILTAQEVVPMKPHTYVADDPVSATCEHTGLTSGVHCAACGTVFLAQAETPALGHLWDEPTYTWSEDHTEVTAMRICSRDKKHVETETVAVTDEVTKEPVCTEMGETTYTSEEFQNTAFTAQTETLINVSAIGHAWSETAYEWSADNSSITATRMCARNENHVETETVSTASKVTKEATCEGKGETTYTAAFENPAFTEQIKTVDNIPALTHAWSATAYEWSADNGSVTATRVCTHDESHVETETVGTDSKVTKAATCEGKGETTYTATFEDAAFEEQTKIVDNIPATGHTLTAHAKVKATCAAEGTEAYLECTVCHKLFSNADATGEIEAPVAIPKDDHDWKAPTYEWNDENTEVTTKRVCANNQEHVETETVGINHRELVTAPAETEAGAYLLVSEAFTNPAFVVQTKAMDIAPLEELNVLWLPGMLKVVRAETFVGSVAEALIVPESCTVIQPNAFMNCPNLLYVRIPEGTSVADGAFVGCPNILIDRTASAQPEQP